MDEIALFPLRAVLLPGGRIPLQIFEPRYLDMVTRCMKRELTFGIVRITEGHEVILSQGTRPPAICEIGTLAEIVDWDGLPAGRLRITVEGSRRFRVGDCREQPDHLLLAQVEWLADAEPQPVDEGYSHLAEIMAGLAEHPALARLGVQPHPSSASQLAYQLAQYLPLDESDRYAVLSGPEPMAGLAFLDRIVKELGGGP